MTRLPIVVGALALAVISLPTLGAQTAPPPDKLFATAQHKETVDGDLKGADWFNVTGGLAMLVGRFMLMIPVLAIAGSLGRKQPTPASAGTFPTDTGLFASLLTGVVVIVVGLTYFPVVALGPVVEHLVGKF